MERKEAIEIVRSNFLNGRIMLSEALETLIPELKENEDYDENVRKNCIHFLKLQKSHHTAILEIEDCIAWLEKQGEQKSKDKYTFNSIPRLLEMIKPTDRAKRYCQKLIDSLQQEGYVTDAKIISEHLKLMNGEKVSMATMDGKQGEQKETLCDKCRREQPYHSCQDITELGRCALEHQSNQTSAWSEEEEAILKAIIQDIQERHPNAMWKIDASKTVAVSTKFIIKFLKSLNPQLHWKPTEEQMQTLHSKLIEGSVIYPDDVRVFTTLYEDLQKLLKE